MNLCFFLLGFTSVISQNSFFSIRDSKGMNNLSGGDFCINIEQDFYKMTGFLSLKTGFDHCDSTKMGIYDPKVGIGVNTNLLSSYLNIVPVFSLPLGDGGIKRNYTVHRGGAGVRIHYIQSFNYIIDASLDIIKYFNNLYDINFQTNFTLKPKFFGFDIGIKYHTYQYKNVNFDKLYFVPTLIYRSKKDFYISAGLEFRISQAQISNPTLDTIGILTGIDASPPWYLSISFSYMPRWETKRKKKIPVYFHLLDQKTGNPVSGLISIEGIGSIMTDSTGVGKIELYPDMYDITILKKGYVNIDTTCNIRSKKDVFIFLTSPAHKGWITGMVADRKTGNPLYASITIVQSNKGPFYSDKLTGIYNFTLPPGSYVVKVEAKGYFIYTGVIDIKDSERSIKNFYLLKKG